MTGLDYRKHWLKTILESDKTDATPIVLAKSLTAARKLLAQATLSPNLTSKSLLISILDFEYHGWAAKPQSYRIQNAFCYYFAGLMGMPNNVRVASWASDYAKQKEKK